MGIIKNLDQDKKGQDVFNRIKKLLTIENDTWVPLKEIVQYTMLGYHHDTEKLLYVENYKNSHAVPLISIPTTFGNIFIFLRDPASNLKSLLY